MCDVASHVRDDKVFDIGVGSDLLFEVFNIDDVLVGAFDVDGFSASVNDAAGDGGECERVGEYSIAMFDTGSFEGEEDRASARVDSDSVVVSNQRAEFGFEEGDLASGFVSEFLLVGWVGELAVKVVAV